MAASTNTQVIFIKRPTAMPVPAETFRVAHAAVPQPKDGQVLVRSLYLSLDPAMRGWMNDTRSYIPPVAIGDVMRAQVIAEVVTSTVGKFKKGDIVTGSAGWQEYAAMDAKELKHIPLPPGLSIPEAFCLLNMTGMTAYFGMLAVGKPKPGETVVVSGAAGATGSLAAQIAKAQGCRVIGIAGGAEKCRYLTEALGLDAAVDYRSPTFKKDLAAVTPNYIDVFFDNVGGDVLDAVLVRLAKGARIPLCGAISQYNTRSPRGPANYLTLIAQRATMQGFIVFDYAPEFRKAAEDLIRWHKEGKVKVAVHIVDGLTQAPEALLMLFTGKNQGKLLVRVAEPSTQSRL
ncbi:hypothetical protein THASP1DRAFT_12699 [Thamnocephalis sphaerospora]|uniref:Enoyl reductase (ER) domain-containing protein n=1 Tax=Thamnocephalis sphaerospora TaxID=78915 RepID=A0A4P9XW43_9FUNG|nr:hypothetical protein THASP1DRAFT_12699 [Thamnocephalis sphaerospora]|eukprot:RKP10545.1 hypothetical protein THASP1DRAFT_12699 [Thamnocephalis sphaerospora]